MTLENTINKKPIPMSAPDRNSDLKKSKRLKMMPMTKSNVPKILFCVVVIGEVVLKT